MICEEIFDESSQPSAEGNNYSLVNIFNITIQFFSAFSLTF